MEDSPIALDKWLCAIWLIANAKNGISSYEIGRALGVTQKTGWFMLHRIRLALQNGTIVKIKGEVEVDETFIGGRARSMSKSRRLKSIPGRGVCGKTAVQGLLERHSKKGGSKIIAKVVRNTSRKTLHGNVREYVLKGSDVFTDALQSYNKLNEEYNHQVIDHAQCYAKGKIHTNGLENFWSLLKRSIRGTYVSVEPFHLFRYLDEQAFRFNEREGNDSGRFLKAVEGIIGKGLRYVELIGKAGSQEGQTAAA